MKQIVDFSRRYLLRYWMWFLGGAICLFGTNWLAVQIPLQLARAVDALHKQNKEVLISAIIAIAIMGACVIAVRTLSRVLFFTPGRLAEFQLKNDLFARMLELQPAFYAEWKTGDIVSRTSNDLTFVRVMTGFGGLQIINISTVVVLAGTQMFLLSPWLTLLSLIPLGVAMIIVQSGIRRLFNLFKQSQEELSELSEHILASLQGMQTIQGFNAQHPFVKRFLERNTNYLNTNLRLATIRSIILPLLALAGAVCIWVLLAVGGPMTVNKQLSVGQLVAFTSYIALLLMPLRSMGWLLSVFQRGRISLSRVMELLDAEPERPDLPNPKTLPVGKGPGFSFRDLSFAYPDASEEATIHDLSVELPSGALIGIFGRTGSGKTTLLRLLTRTYNPPPGTLFVDGIDIRDLDLDAWRRRMAVVTQAPFLFSDTISSNITMDKPEPARLQQAIDAAALQRDIEALPDGLETVVGQRGIMLSGGQRQRVALARALYRQFDLLVLDDVLSAVDHQTEHQLIETIKTVNTSTEHKPTTILVSHRLSALAHADTILVLEEGRLLTQGTHQELIQHPGPYREAWLHQSEKNEDAEEDEETLAPEAALSPSVA